ncbi:MAG TPA: hypothetical protein VJB14_11910 [Planctomycetota bacterium]|nr:hypothetical protein [Planctomycetota bacterium]
MSWLQLHPEGLAARVKESGRPLDVPTLGASLLRGIVGFTIVSVAGFAPWALTGGWVRKAVGEAGMYAACAVVFIGLTGPLLHRLILGPGSLARFYKLFGVAFAAYSVAWIAGWMALGGHKGSLAGLFAGTAVMGTILAAAFGSRSAALPSIAALFVLNSAGYFVGGWVEAAVARSGPLPLAMTLWGVCYGIGLGAGLGLAFHLCQADHRMRPAAGSGEGDEPNR